MDMLTDVKIKKDPTVKPALKSKTLWGNFLMGGLAILGMNIPALTPYLTPEFMTSLFAIGNIVLRFYTEDRLVVSKINDAFGSKDAKKLNDTFNNK